MAFLEFSADEVLMKKDVVILVAEDDDGHFWLIKRNLQREGIGNRILQFADGQEVLDFL